MYITLTILYNIHSMVSLSVSSKCNKKKQVVRKYNTKPKHSMDQFTINQQRNTKSGDYCIDSLWISSINEHTSRQLITQTNRQKQSRSKMAVDSCWDRTRLPVHTQQSTIDVSLTLIAVDIQPQPGKKCNSSTPWQKQMSMRSVWLNAMFGNVQNWSLMEVDC